MESEPKSINLELPTSNLKTDRRSTDSTRRATAKRKLKYSRSYENSIRMNQVYLMLVAQRTIPEMSKVLGISERHTFRLLDQVKCQLAKGSGGPFVPETAQEMIGSNLAIWKSVLSDLIILSKSTSDSRERIVCLRQMAETTKMISDYQLRVGLVAESPQLPMLPSGQIPEVKPVQPEKKDEELNLGNYTPEKAKELLKRHHDRIFGIPTKDPDISGANAPAGQTAGGDGLPAPGAANGGSIDIQTVGS